MTAMGSKRDGTRKKRVSQEPQGSGRQRGSQHKERELVRASTSKVGLYRRSQLGAPALQTSGSFDSFPSSTTSMRKVVEFPWLEEPARRS